MFKGQTNLVGGLIGVLVAVIIGVSVTVVTINQVITDNPSLNGTTQSLLKLLPTLVMVVLVVGTVSLIAGR